MMVAGEPGSVLRGKKGPSESAAPLLTCCWHHRAPAACALAAAFLKLHPGCLDSCPTGPRVLIRAYVGS